MKTTDVGDLFLRRFGVRLGPAMCDYVARQLTAGGPLPDTLPVMGGDAKTGVPVRYVATVEEVISH